MSAHQCTPFIEEHMIVNQKYLNLILKMTFILPERGPFLGPCEVNQGGEQGVQQFDYHQSHELITSHRLDYTHSHRG